MSNTSPYTQLTQNPGSAATLLVDQRRSLKGMAGIFFGLFFVTTLVALATNWTLEASKKLSVGAPEKFPGEGSAYPWSNEMLTWQRTGYHFQPEKNWMNDPNGPLFYKGWYHLFYQYNPYSAAWGNITWGHAVSTGLINWLHLPVAMVPDTLSDIGGVWTGSATLLPDSRIMMVYTGISNDSVEVQNLAYPADPSDPLLVHWVKYPGNPVMVPPPGVYRRDFRDPTTAWQAGDSTWRIAIGSQKNGTGMVLVYQTTNFTSFELLDGVMHSIPGTGMWECVDFFPVSTTEKRGLDTSLNGPGIKHVLKASLFDAQKDFYAIGSYDTETGTWTPDNSEMDLGVGLRLDYGKYYAAKTFYDQNKQRRILWAWIGETDTVQIDLLKGWASVQGIPRSVVFDEDTGTNLLQWPIEEVEKLRLNSTQYDVVELGPGSLVPLHVSSTAQLDISATFEVDAKALEGKREADARYDCSTGGAAVRGTSGPFGLVVIADDELSEFTPVYFYISKLVDGHFVNFFCADQSRSSKASDVDKSVYGSTVPVLDGEKLSMRLLVDHSIVESFAQGGRTVITSRIYPTHVANGASRLFLFNNATGVNVKASVMLWDMKSADIKQFPSDPK